ncbi:DUF2442 domain-containing protein [Candidatus Babeliales bacterium]|nr:DUF2442 domain-containing protein [Candidatus Babeliales bacterium]
MNKIHEVKSKGLNGSILELIVDSCTYRINLANESEKLAQATPAQLEDFIVSPSGYGIHWPQLDEDLALDPLIGIQHESPVWKVAEDISAYKTKKDEP